MSDDITLSPGQVWYNPPGTLAIVIQKIDGGLVHLTHHVAGPFAPVKAYQAIDAVKDIIAEYQMTEERKA